MTEALDVRPLADGEEAAVIALWQACGLTRPWNDPHKDLSFARAQENSDVLVGMREDALCASVLVGHDGHRGAVYYVSVDPALRGRGYGAVIMKAAEDWLRERGVWKLNLVVRADNAPVKAFYEALGYEVEERLNLSKRL